MKRKIFAVLLALVLCLSMAFTVSAAGYDDGWDGFDVEQALWIAGIAGLVIGLIVALILWGQLKTVRPQDQADAYIRPGSMQIRSRSDRFLYRNVSRIKKSTNK